MFEAATDKKTRDAIQRAHDERSQVLRDAWQWLFPFADAR